MTETEYGYYTIFCLKVHLCKARPGQLEKIDYLSLSSFLVATTNLTLDIILTIINELAIALFIDKPFSLVITNITIQGSRDVH